MPIALAAGGYVCVLITLIVYMYSLTLRTTEARQFARYLEACPATGLALILTSLAVITAPKWSWVFWISVAGFIAAYLVSLALSPFFFAAAMFCCLALVLAIMRIPNTVRSQAAMILLGFWVGAMILGQLEVSSSRRSFLSRAQDEMRSIAIALESYRVDYNVFPPSTTNPARRMMWESDSPMQSLMRAWPGGPNSLTAPVSYISQLPVDPMRYQSEKRTYAYYCAPNGQKCVVIGAGINCVFDLKPEDLDELTSNPLRFVNYQYDPTNGTASAGDIFRVEPR